LATWVETHAEAEAHAEGPCELTRFVVHEVLKPCGMGVCELAALSSPSRAAAVLRSPPSHNTTRIQSSSGGGVEGGDCEGGRVGGGEGSSGGDSESESDSDEEDDEAAGRGAALAGMYAAPPGVLRDERRSPLYPVGAAWSSP